MISILIPVYNFDVTVLINQLLAQIKGVNEFEILCYDDASTNKYTPPAHPFLTYKTLESNIGRSAIRNLLAHDAKGDYILFIDGDSLIQDNFIEIYQSSIQTADALFGGTIYSKELQGSTCSLRWKYGKKREERTAGVRNTSPYSSITLNNVLIKRDVFLSILLDESITTYGHEDTAFGYQLKKHQIRVKHVNNPVIHIGLESNMLYLDKVREAVKNYFLLTTSKGIGKDVPLFKSYNILVKSGLKWVYLFVYFLFIRDIETNLLSKNPSIRLLDIYKLYWMLKQ